MSARQWRRPGAFAVALTLAAVALFVALGTWQLGRGAAKERLLAAFDEAAREAPRPFDPARDAADEARFPHVRVSGRFVPDRGYLLDERVHDGKLGVHAIGVFERDAPAALLLVDRGWIAWDHAPGTQPQLPPLPQGDIAVSGIYAPFPGAGLRVGGNALEHQSAWPKLTLALDANAIAAVLARPVLPRLLLLDAAPGSGFVREWTPAVLPPERHLAYAVQWFAFAVAALAAFVAIHWRKTEDGT